MQNETNPYLEGRKEWAERYGSYIAQAANWRMAAIGSMTVSLILAGGMVTVASKSKFIPYVVEVDKLGAIAAVGPADRMQQPGDIILKSALRGLIEDIRLVSSDSGLQIKAIKRVYAKVPSGSPTKVFLDQYYKDNDPFKAAELKTIDVQVTLVMPVSAKSWQVEWAETARDKNGNILGNTHWKSTLTIDFNPPATGDELTINPLGIFVTSITWAKQL
jgi:type IV secretory pathway TrbF-like protein